ncbi:MAG: HupE/UreJ family protein [Flavobacteriales bacterium]|nr:HupE/UreJ family protein [Flavobacteriales bacterium]
MDEFSLWFGTGMEHIADWNGYDHMLFLLALCGVYELKDWKKIFILISAFTIGHSITLALSVFNILRIPSPLIEFMIPVTIVITCFNHLRQITNITNQNIYLSYSMALIFGFIHGMGFSTLLRSMLGNETSIVLPLLFFNLGIEAGQAIIVIGIMLFSLFLTRVAGIRPERWKFYITSAVSGVAMLIMAERIPALFE